MLASATADTFPVKTAPPIITSFRIRPARSGSRNRATAILVRGAVVSKVSSPEYSWLSLNIMSAADSSTGNLFGGDRKEFPSPSSPCTKGAVFNGACKGLSAPEATGISSSSISQTLSVFKVVCATSTFPPTVVLPRIFS